MLTENDNRVMSFYFYDPDSSHYIRELARLTGLSAPGVLKILERLRKFRLLSVQKSIAVTNVSIGEKFFQAKRLFNIESLYDSGLVEYLKGEVIVVIGKYSDGIDKKDDPIEIVLITEKKCKYNLEKFEQKLKRKISIIEINSPSSMGELEKLANGIVLSGRLKL